jgi:putative secretion ATPase (PEP-CTERM system associated)
VYESFYGLSDKPFQLNPDPSFYYGSKEHRRAMAYLDYGLHKNEGFIVVTGEVGAGKTTVVRNLLSKLDPDKVVAAQVVTTQLNADDTLRMVAASFGLRVTNMSKSEMLLSIEAFLLKLSLQGKRGLLIIDEAQNLTPQAVEELRMLSNYQLETHALLQSFLVGQPEFRRMLESPEMLQLRQRVIAGCHIGPLDREETRAYIEHRLHHVDWKDDPSFEADAYESIFEASEGIPRRINTVCDRLLLSGYLAGKHVITSEDVKQAAREIQDETRSPSSSATQSTAPINGSAVRRPDDGLEVKLGELDLSALQVDPATADKAYSILATLQAGNFEERIARLERASAATTAVLRELLNAVRARQPENRDDAT